MSETSQANRLLDETIRLLTYNVHGCVGTDGRLSSKRIADVIAEADPDIAALQELDVRRPRSELRHQVRDIAAELQMDWEFHATLRIEAEEFGNAILSRLPLRRIRAGELPNRLGRPSEPRGALWVEVLHGDCALQVITTHLGLSSPERQRQVAALLSRDWLEPAIGRSPIVFCGDLNLPPWSRPYRVLTAHLHDAQRAAGGRPRATFPSRWPILRIDHIFATHHIEFTRAEVLRTRLTQLASDHLPVLAEFRTAEVHNEESSVSQVEREGKTSDGPAH